MLRPLFQGDIAVGCLVILFMNKEIDMLVCTTIIESGLDISSANTIIVVGKSDPPVYAACVVLATTRLDVNKAVRKRLGVRKASFAGADATRDLTGMEIGGVTPFGLPPDLPLWIDARVMERPRIILGGGSRDRKVLAAPAILTAAGGERVADLARPLPPPSAE